MTTSTNEEGVEIDDVMDTPEETSGAFADALTCLRILLVPLIVFLIWKGWQPVEQGGINLNLAVLSSALFFIAALTDIFDDFLGGNEQSAYRKYGYLDDVADTVLVIGTLAALIFVLNRAGVLTWTITVPVAVLILREVIVGLVKGYELTRYIWPNTLLSNAKSGFAMLGTCLLIASPWLQSWIDQIRAGTDNVEAVLASTSPLIWLLGTIAIWVAAILSIITGVILLRTKLDETLLDDVSE